MRERPSGIRRKVIVSAVVLAAIVASVLLAARLNPLVREGNSADFWYAACGVCLDGNYMFRRGGSMKAYPARDGWLVYQPTGYIDSPAPVYRIREEEAFKDFPDVVHHLKRADLGDYFRNLDLSRWQENGPDASQPRIFLQEVRSARLASLKQLSTASSQRHLAQERDVDEYWQRAHNWRPVLVVLEIIYFTALAVFLLWPWWRSAGCLWWCVHLGWLPWLFLLPYWLGYAPMTFSPAANSEEGVLYPALLSSLPRLDWNEVDSLLLLPIPRPLLSLPGNPGPLFPCPCQNGYGPVAALFWSTALCAAVLLGWGVTIDLRKRLRSGGESPEPEAVGPAELKWWMQDRGHER
jgi:hypothetical protein